MNEEKLTVKVDAIGVDEATEKLERYIDLLKEAKTLADELASVELDLTFSTQE